LNFKIIYADSSLTTGRVERAHKTLPDRLIKESRLAGAPTLAVGNALLRTFMVLHYDASFATPPADAKDLHPLLSAGGFLEDTFAWKEERTLSHASTLQYDKAIFILEPSEPANAAIGKRVTCSIIPIADWDLLQRVEPAYPPFQKIRQVNPGAIADIKRRGPKSAMIRNKQLHRGGPSVTSGPRGAVSIRPAFQGPLSCSTSPES
jgi:hypothetical protein